MTTVVPPLRVVEFFSGIGGWHSALNRMDGARPVDVVAAYDVNTVANTVYEYVYSKPKPSSQSIDTLTVKALDGLRADVWCMSPPCQPFTRQHAPATENDPRTKAFTHLCGVLRQMASPPRYVAVENVVGFETSSSCRLLLDVFDGAGYDYRQFVLTPTQFGVPNERPRYYCVAVRAGLFSPADGGKLQLLDAVPGAPRSPAPAPLRTYLSRHLSADAIEQLVVPEKLLAKNASWCMDIVTEADATTSCFTKAYSTYFKGTGSVLLFPDAHMATNELDAGSSSSSSSSGGGTSGSGTAPSADVGEDSDGMAGAASVFQQAPSKRKFDANWQSALQGRRLRFFAPEELARLFGFVDIDVEASANGDASAGITGGSGVFFPPGVSHRKCYELIGNSLSVVVVGHLLRYMFSAGPGPGAGASSTDT